jgi:uncharacterized RDD family membrane protein YckC
MSASSRRARARAMSGQRAGLFSRLIVTGIDFCVVFAILFGLIVVSAVGRYMLGEGFELPSVVPIATGTGYVVVEFLYLAVSWSVTGRSVGKRVVGLRVIRNDGRRLGRSTACGRAALCSFFGLPGLLWAGVSSRNAAIHDLIARTAVVHDWAEADRRLVSSTVVAAAAPPALSEA